MTDFTEAPKLEPLPPAPLCVRFKRLAVRVLVVLALVAAIVALGGMQTGRVGQKRLDSIVAKLDAEESGWRMEDIEAERRTRMPPPDKNSAPVVLAAAERLDPTWEQTWRPDALWLWCLPEPNLPAPKHIEQLKAAAQASVEARTLALRLRDLPVGHHAVTFPADSFTLASPHLGKADSTAVLLEFDACVAVVVDGDPNRTVRAAHAALNVARSIGDEPTAHAQYTRIACRNRAARITTQTLAWSSPTEGLAELQSALLTEAEAPVLLDAMRGHRANMHRLFCGLAAERFEYRDVLRSAGVPEPGFARAGMFRTYRPLLPGDHAEALRRLTIGVAIAKLPSHEQYPAARTAFEDEDSNDLRYPLSNFFVRTLDSCVTSVLISRAELTTAAVGIACERFRLLHDRWPTELSEIPKSILPTVPVSPFDGTALRYRVLDDRIAITCRLAHETLRAGESLKFEDPDALGLTVGARLWYPKCRAGPPKPTDPDPE